MKGVRAKDLRGPYLDANGTRMDQGGGTPVIAGNKRWPGVGHNSAYTFDGRDYLVRNNEAAPRQLDANGTANPARTTSHQGNTSIEVGHSSSPRRDLAARSVSAQRGKPYRGAPARSHSSP